MSTKVSSNLDWVDVTILSIVPVVDNEYIKTFRRQHRLCKGREDEEEYEIVAPNPEDRNCFSRLDKSECHFVFMYECLFTRLGVSLSFSDFELEILRICRVFPSQVHPNSWSFMKVYQLVSWELDLP
ncbi:hypothetical protein AHAS_Ahas03G0380400 [Arachis hypogaea]